MNFSPLQLNINRDNREDLAIIISYFSEQTEKHAFMRMLAQLRLSKKLFLKPKTAIIIPLN